MIGSPGGIDPTRARPRRGSSFGIAFRVLAPPRREGIRAVYAFCRRADDAVDEASDPLAAREALDHVRRHLDEVFAGNGRDPAVVRLRAAVRAFDLPRAPFEDLLEGISWDLEGRRYATARDLRDYCRRVASTVGLLCVRIFGCTDGACDPYAEELGVALQWTNILRDIGADLARGRCYLPLDSLRGNGLSADDLGRRDGGSRPRLDAVVREQTAYARACFASARLLLPDAERGRVLAGEIMAGVYRLLLRRIERAGSKVMDRELRVSVARRGLVALRIVLLDRLRLAPGKNR